MLAFWPEIVHPLLEVLRPQSIVEIGSEAGRTTRLLLQLASQLGSTVHSIDPGPVFDVAAWQKEFGDQFVFHRLPSLVALCAIQRMDAVLIDGDHNWFTVFNELKLIESQCLENQQGMPLILLHDVVWPYGRRDLYYAPDAIPAEHRQPWAKKGISISRSELLEQGGFNPKMCNALREGGPKNGVLTAVEDYLAQTIFKYKLVVIPAVFGLAVLLPEPLAAEKPALANLLAPWAAPAIGKFLERLEMARISMLTGGV